MNFFLKKNRLLISAIFAGFLIIAVVERPLLGNAMKGKEKDFNDKLFYVVGMLEESITRDSALMSHINSDREMISILQTDIRHKIDSVFIKNTIPDDYVFAVGKVKNEQIAVSELGKFSRAFRSDNLIWSSDSINISNIVDTRLKIGYLGAPGKRIYYVKIFLPHKQRYLLWSLLPELVTMGITMVILFICFLLLLSIIRKQNNLARYRDDFISNITHELKTPLFTISIAAKMLEEQENIKSNGKYVGYLKTIRQEASRLLNLADKVMESSEMETHSIPTEKEEVDVHIIMRNACSRLELAKLERAAKIEMKLGAQQHHVLGHDKNLENVFVNIIDNALKYSARQLLIVITTKNEGTNILISVADNGIGFDPSTRELIFERFYRAHTGNVHNVKGYGIGLSFAKTVIDNHDGRITVNTTPGKGSEFIIILPSTSSTL